MFSEAKRVAVAIAIRTYLHDLIAIVPKETRNGDMDDGVLDDPVASASAQLLKRSELTFKEYLQGRTQIDSQGRKIKVLVVDAQPIVREGLASLLMRHPTIELLLTAGNEDSLIRYIEATMPDVVLFDPGPAYSPGIQEMLAVLARWPETRFILFTSWQKEEDVHRAVANGARGYLLKTEPVAEILSCIEAVSRGEQWISSSTRVVLERRHRAPELTKRERDVLAALAQGMSNKQIGCELKLREGTVKIHMGNIFCKLQVENRAEALSVAIARGLVSPISACRTTRMLIRGAHVNREAA